MCLNILVEDYKQKLTQLELQKNKKQKKTVRDELNRVSSHILATDTFIWLLFV